VLDAYPLRTRIPVRTTSTRLHDPNIVHVVRYNQTILESRQLLARPSITARNQTWLCSTISSLEALLRTARDALPDDIAELVARYASPPVYGPQPRPFNEAARRQDAEARIRRTQAASRGDARPWYISTPTKAEYPPHYSHPYDDIMGTRSLDDGSAAAYAIRDGEDVTYEKRFSYRYHNGLSLRRGHLHITTEDRNLVEARQARHLAGLSTKEMDEEITHRVARDYDSWGWVGQCLRENEWAERAMCYCESVNCRAGRDLRVDGQEFPGASRHSRVNSTG
jgi:hypothetical protein